MPRVGVWACAWVPVGVGGREHNAVLCLGVGVCAGVVGVGVGVGVVIVIVATKKLPENQPLVFGQKKCPVARGHGAMGAYQLLGVLYLDRLFRRRDHGNVISLFDAGQDQGI